MYKKKEILNSPNLCNCILGIYNYLVLLGNVICPQSDQNNSYEMPMNGHEARIKNETRNVIFGLQL